MGTVMVPFGGSAPLRTRFGVRIRKDYGADPRYREHRANMFRSGVLPAVEPSSRVAAKWALGLGGFALFVSMAGAAGGSGGAAMFAILLAPLVGWAVVHLLTKKDVSLPAVNPFEHDKMLAHFRQRTEQAALDRLRYELSEDVRVRTDFESAGIYVINEAIVTKEGFGLDPFEGARTVHVGQAQDGSLKYRFGRYIGHHIFANDTGLSYVMTEWNFIEDEFGQDRRTGKTLYPEPRIVNVNQWVWRAIENLQVEEHSFTIHTFGGKKVRLPYVADIPVSGRLDDPTAYRWYDQPAQPAHDPRFPWAHGSPHVPFDQEQARGLIAHPIHDPALRAELKRLEDAERAKAIEFVNTVNSLRFEWEAAH